MSTQRGNGSRTRPQKHKNRHVFKNDLHDKTPQQKRLNSLQISEVCQHCKGVIEWKIKYKKYKPLSQPKTCTKCAQKNIRKAYHVFCKECALKARVCAKCLKSADEVEIEPPQPTPEEEIKLKIEMERLIKSFSERKRRAFLRYMDKGKNDIEEEPELTSGENKDNGEDKADEELNTSSTKAKLRIPRTRDELLEKIEQLKLQNENDDSDDYDFDSEDDFEGSDEDSTDERKSD